MVKEKKSTGIKNWPVDDRPREKLLKKGTRSLSNSELLAILLRTGTPGISAIDLARGVLKKFGTFRNMTHTDSRNWKGFIRKWEKSQASAVSGWTVPFFFTLEDGEVFDLC